MKRIVGIIPARLASSRLPGKVLADIGGRPLLWHVYRSASRARYLADLWVAADDGIIAAEMRKWNIPCVLTPKSCVSGTARVAAAARKIRADVYVNIQGDEPFMPSANIDLVCRRFLEDPAARIVTLCVPFRSDRESLDPGNVKVVFDRKSRALYFSRSLIPFDRTGTGRPRRYKHLGLYGYDRRTLIGLSRLPHSALAEAEKLEQLGFLENGWDVTVLTAKRDSCGVDTPQDLAQVRAAFKGRRKRI